MKNKLNKKSSPFPASLHLPVLDLVICVRHRDEIPYLLLFFFTYMDNEDLIIRSDLDSRGFFPGDEDLDLALTGGVGSVRLHDTARGIGTAHLFTSGCALNIRIDQQLHTISLRSLPPVIPGCTCKGSLFVPARGPGPDTAGR